MGGVGGIPMIGPRCEVTGGLGMSNHLWFSFEAGLHQLTLGCLVFYFLQSF